MTDSDPRPTEYQAQLGYEARQRALGRVKVSAWVPKEDRAELLDIAQEMREEEDAKRGH